MKLRRGVATVISGISLLFSLSACVSLPILRADVLRVENPGVGVQVEASIRDSESGEPIVIERFSCPENKTCILAETVVRKGVLVVRAEAQEAYVTPVTFPSFGTMREEARADFRASTDDSDNLPAMIEAVQPRFANASSHEIAVALTALDTAKEYAARGETVDPSQIFEPEIPPGSESTKTVEMEYSTEDISVFSTHRGGYGWCGGAALDDTSGGATCRRTVTVAGAPSGKSPELPPRQKSDEFPLPVSKREEPKITHTPALVTPPVLIAAAAPESASWRTAIPQQKPKVPTKKSVTVAAAPKKDCPCEITVTTPQPTVIDQTTIVPQSRDPITSWLLALLAIGIFGITIVLSLILREMRRQNNPANNPRRPPPRA
ncbi:MAG: hypothetical protein UY61_C0007G0006 [Candidatus Adlerbacteria bacterium GW2011_GWC1_50_9]|uniref:Uncharacterized protein n=1 Tax=Candidatus Adlerbacteria bacterium GW2011_GWC1_50_9 TaxID=1618608 RepID=A0A0G1Z225_9BACT|nr:MAG: hypothetical protein UY61_C0007G0006 [Candidatus Adlerbacteria bacterium GW2011_GWC1_50_9]